MQTHLLRESGELSEYHCSVSKARGRAVFENNSKALRGCADRTATSTSRGVVYSACLCGRSYLAPGERPIGYMPCLDGVSSGIGCRDRAMLHLQRD